MKSQEFSEQKSWWMAGRITGGILDGTFPGNVILLIGSFKNPHYVSRHRQELNYCGNPEGTLEGIPRISFLNKINKESSDELCKTFLEEFCKETPAEFWRSAWRIPKFIRGNFWKKISGKSSEKSREDSILDFRENRLGIFPEKSQKECLKISGKKLWKISSEILRKLLFRILGTIFRKKNKRNTWNNSDRYPMRNFAINRFENRWTRSYNLNATNKNILKKILRNFENLWRE